MANTSCFLYFDLRKVPPKYPYYNIKRGKDVKKGSIMISSPCVVSLKSRGRRAAGGRSSPDCFAGALPHVKSVHVSLHFL